MRKHSIWFVIITLLLAWPTLVSAQGNKIPNQLDKCAQGASGPAILVNVSGFRGDKGSIRVQSYRATKEEWLEKGRWLNRIDQPLEVRDQYMQFCIPVPAAGRYGIAVRHDRNGNGKTEIMEDGGGFSNNPSLSIFNLGKPAAGKVGIEVGQGVTAITVRLQYF
jgi:uncharacterized protein (DUF2141 family)